MKWERMLVIVLALWMLGLAIAVQPHAHHPPTISHAQLLEKPVLNLPTLAPPSP